MISPGFLLKEQEQLTTLFNRKAMSYSINKILKGKSFDEATEQVTAELKKEGFGVLTEIDIKETLKKKLDVDFRKYKILGACNPQFAYKALQSEEKIGVFLPCNVVVQEHANGEIEVSAVDPIASMGSVKNTDLEGIAKEVQQKLTRAISNLN
ncbi:conserved hypothetical protein [Imperialibacter sp. EC-SDR9]|nr:conserved hypothetical protein [Imperialibacter sp. 75]CAD5285366.1 conserved hypothetical protein [Imperialibacter sp. 89]VVT23242.1 conserved hypothetical protein [Imperialibacter sp. EC-SDR9]